MKGVETKWGRLGDVAKSTETFLLELEVFLQIWRVGGIWRGSWCLCTPSLIVVWGVNGA